MVNRLQELIRSLGHQVIRSSGHKVIRSLGHQVIRSSGHPVFINFQCCYRLTDPQVTGLLCRQINSKFQETLCSSPQELECANNVKVDTSSCLKPCSGLIVTSFAKSELKKDLETLFPIFRDYNLYKRVSTYPSVANGMSAFILMLFLLSIILNIRL